MNRSQELQRNGQSVWLDYIRRGLITSGELDRMVRDGWITGVTSNPTIFQKAIASSHDYDEHLRRIADRGECSPYEAFLELGSEDIRLAAEALRPVYDSTKKADGYVSFEAQEGEAEQIIAEGKRMFELVGRPNVMIKVPGIPAGIEAVPSLIAAGVNVNITLLFDVDVYEQVADAYIRGLERRLDEGQPLPDVASVASFFVSRVDTKVDGQLPEGSPLRGKIAVANARLAYKRFLSIFSGPRWERLAASGARVQRPLWASTGTKNPDYSDVLYVDDLVAPHTVNTMPEATLRAVLDHGRTEPAIEEGLADAERVIRQVPAEGVDLKTICAQLLDEGLSAFRKDFAQLLDEIGKVLHAMPEHRAYVSANLHGLSEKVDQRLVRFEKENMSSRLWEGDYTLWKSQPTEITNRLGWLCVVDMMMDYQGQLRPFAEEVAKDGYDTAVLLGMGGSSLGPEVLFATYGAAQGALSLSVLDTTDPGAISALESKIELDRTLFIVASKSGTTLETLSHLAYFWEKIPDPRHFIAITDEGTPLETLARERAFRRVFLNPAEIGGRYSVLSYFGLVPAALIGVDLAALLDRAHDMLHACHPCVAPAHNPGAWLGAVMAEAALAGRDKLTLILPQEISTFGYWVEQLIAESTGKEGKGILPVEGEPLGPPEVYGQDRLFVAIGDDGLSPLEQAGHPVVRLPYSGPLDLGAEFFRWEFATAVAGHVLAINPFDQPNVQQAKDATARILSAPGTPPEPETEPLASVLERVRPGDYIAIQAYLARGAAVEAALQSARRTLRDRYRVATTVGYGPRFLHSTGQLHKGGPNTGVFIQVIGEDAHDLPIPGKPYTFGALKRAQALGDLESLRARGARVTRVRLNELEEALR